MPTIPSIQALIGPHTQQSSGNVQCGVDWVRNNAFIIGNQSGTNYISSVGLLSGTEQAFQTMASFTPNGQGSPPVGVDGNGDVYIPWGGLHGGGLLQLDGTTLAEITFGGADLPDPAGWLIVGGTLSNVISGSAQFMVATQQGGLFSFLRNTVVFNEVTFSGTSQNYGNAFAYTCPGKTGTNFGFTLAGPTAAGDTQTLVLSVVFCSSGGTTITPIITLVPTDIDPAWTQIYPKGLCVDQTDGNIIISCKGQNGATHPGYLAKLDASTGAVLWTHALPNTSSIGGKQLAFSNITNQRFCYVTDGPPKVTTVNTADGSSSSYTAGLAGLTVFGQQAFNDAIGAIICNVTFAVTAGSPTQLNATPNSFTGWSILYVAAPPAPPPGNRRFLSQCGPVRTGAPSSSPIIPPTPPPPPPAPPVVTDITSEADEPLITEASSNIITES